MASPLLIEINTRCRLREKSRRLGRKVILAGVTAAEIQRWRKTGFTHVWLMGVWTNGPRARKHSLESPGLRDAYDRALPGWTEEDVAGSPYAVAGYEVAPELGGTKALLAFRKKLNGAGLKLILDFVPNHVGLDHPWVTAHPERFVQADTIDVESFIGGSAEYPVRLCHGRDPYFEPWLDTAQLDLRREDTRSAVLEDLLSVAELCDGVRCDMAMLLLSEIFAETWRHHAVRGKETKGEFWPVAISTVRRRFPEFLFIAEAYWNREEEL
ncbi:MAG TPA: alpha-amylase, partial [Verrucomicrobiales bacterium]|nr:alpha-amylase [Verrucomicrobiales bacterium]